MVTEFKYSLVTLLNNYINFFIFLQECLNFCQDYSGCSYFTYLENERTCEGFSDCLEISPVCDNCFTGSTSCDGKTIFQHFCIQTDGKRFSKLENEVTINLFRLVLLLFWHMFGNSDN